MRSEAPSAVAPPEIGGRRTEDGGRMAGETTTACVGFGKSARANCVEMEVERPSIPTGFRTAGPALWIGA